jgi:hypothetical protein
VISNGSIDRLAADAMLAAAALYSFWYALKAWRESRSVQDTPTSRVRSAAQGYVGLSGRVLLPEGVENRSPLTRQPCAWWSYTVEESNDDNRSGSWSTNDRGTSEILFFLDDGTGRCLVDPRGAEVVSEDKSVWYGSTPWPEFRLPDSPGAAGAAGKLFDMVVRGKYRYTEHRLRIGSPLYAVGAFRSVGGVGNVDVASVAAELLRTWKKDQAGLLARFDKDHDGSISSAEWEAARCAAADQVLSEEAARKPAPTVNVLGAPNDGRAFVLSCSDGAALARRLRWRALGGVTGFLLALTAATLLISRG